MLSTILILYKPFLGWREALKKSNSIQPPKEKVLKKIALQFPRIFKPVQYRVMVCVLSSFFLNKITAQMDVDSIAVNTLTLRPLNELIDLALLNAADLKTNQIDYARQAVAVQLQKRAWFDNISVNTASSYGNGTVAGASNNGLGTIYALSENKSLSFNVGLGIRLGGGDVFNRGNKMQSQRLLLERVQNERLILESHIKEVVINLYTELELTMKVVKLRGDVVENQRLTLTLADKYYKEGKYKPAEYSGLLDKITAAQEQYEQSKATAKKLSLLLQNLVNTSIWK